MGGGSRSEGIDRDPTLLKLSEHFFSALFIHLDTASTFEVSTLDVLRQTMPDYRLIGCGPTDAAVRHAFDGWIEYGQPHSAFVGAAFAGALAVVPGRSESMGMAHAEAQVAGACVVASADQVPKQILVPEATVTYEGAMASRWPERLRLQPREIRLEFASRRCNTSISPMSSRVPAPLLDCSNGGDCCGSRATRRFDGPPLMAFVDRAFDPFVHYLKSLRQVVADGLSEQFALGSGLANDDLGRAVAASDLLQHSPFAALSPGRVSASEVYFL